MISAIRKFFARGERPQGAGVASVDAQPDHVPRRSDRRSVHWKLTSTQQEMLKEYDCVFNEETINIRFWKRGDGKRWLMWHMAKLVDKLPRNTPVPKRVNGVKFVVDKDGHPIRLMEANNGVIFLVSCKGKFRALKVAYKHMSGEREVIYEAALMGFTSPSGATPKVYGLVGVKSSQFAKVGILMEYFGTKNDYKAPTLQELLGDHYMSEEEWKDLSFKLCDKVRELQKMGVCITNLSPKNIILHPKNKQFIITDFGMAMYSCIPMTLNLDIPAEKVARSYPFMAPELIFESKFHANTDTYSLALILHKLSECLGMTPEEAAFILEPYYNPDPEMRPAIEMMQGGLRMYLEDCQPIHINGYDFVYRKLPYFMSPIH